MIVMHSKYSLYHQCVYYTIYLCRLTPYHSMPEMEMERKIVDCDPTASIVQWSGESSLVLSY